MVLLSRRDPLRPGTQADWLLPVGLGARIVVVDANGHDYPLPT
jgi:hypothetical protein